MRTMAPIGSVSPNSFSNMVVPSSTTLAARLLSSGVISRPAVTPHSRAVK
jgi:hypothetical protein